VKVSTSDLSQRAAGSHDCALEISGERSTLTTIAEVIDNADEQSIVLLLDHVVDPQNLGAILRSADQFSVDAVIVPERRAAPLTAAVIQASAGTASYVPLITVKNLPRAIEELQRGAFWVFAAEMAGEALHRAKLDGRIVLVMGAEGGGVSRLVAERSDGLVAIPMAGHADSLNVSVACGILLYEVRRQQGWLDTISGRT
jgi:23S rRNA (guanosine2251-2'-O)-methyltransferase